MTLHFQFFFFPIFPHFNIILNAFHYVETMPTVISTIESHAKHLIKPRTSVWCICCVKSRNRQRDKEKTKTAAKINITRKKRDSHAKEFAAIFVHFHFSCFHLAEHATYFALLEAVECAEWKSAFLLWPNGVRRKESKYTEEVGKNEPFTATLLWYSECFKCSMVCQYMHAYLYYICEMRWMQKMAKLTKQNRRKKCKRESIRSEINLQLGIRRFNCKSCWIECILAKASGSMFGAYGFSSLDIHSFM